MIFYDTHAHLNDRAFSSVLEEVLERARASGVARINVVGWDAPSSREAVRLSERYPDLLRAVVGIHPNYSSGWQDSWLREIEELIGEPGVVAVGEIGLDLYREYSPLLDQEKAVRAQMGLAIERGIPVVLHIRKAFNRIIPILEEMNPQRVIMHAFSGGLNEALWAAERGYLLSVTGVIVRGSKRLKSVIKKLGAACLVAETDCPFISDEPAMLKPIVEKVASVLEAPAETVASELWENSMRFFGGLTGIPPEP